MYTKQNPAATINRFIIKALGVYSQTNTENVVVRGYKQSQTHVQCNRLLYASVLQLILELLCLVVVKHS